MKEGNFRDDEDYRDFLEAVTGRRSAGALTLKQIGLVIKEFEANGFTRQVLSKSPKSRHKPRKTRADKCVALWIDLSKRGIVRDSSHSALQAFVRRQLGKKLKILPGVDPLLAASPQQLTAVIQALEAMRDGGSA